MASLGAWAVKTQQSMDDFAEVGETIFGVKKRLRFIRSALENHQTPTVLDIGCGTGELVTLPLARRGWKITAMDVHAESIAHGNAAGVENAKFICGYLSDLAATKNSTSLSCRRFLSMSTIRWICSGRSASGLPMAAA